MEERDRQTDRQIVLVGVRESTRLNFRVSLSQTRNQVTI